MKVKKKKKYLVCFIFVLSIFVFVFFTRKETVEDHSKPEGLVALTTSDGSKTNLVLRVNNEQIVVSTASANYTQPFSRGDFIVWVEEQQEKSEKHIVRYHVPTKTTLYITNSGVAQNPKVTTQGQVVWQSWINEMWHIFYFDGNTSQQVTSEPSNHTNPDIADDIIVFAKKNAENMWQTIKYSTKTKSSQIIKDGIEAKFPYFYGTQLFFR